MGVYKRGTTYWYKFVFRGETIRRSTKQGNARVAGQMEAAHKTALAKGEVGIHDTPGHAPTFAAFTKRFLDFVEATSDKPRTVKMYRTASRGLLAFPKLANARIDAIDEAVVDAFKQWRVRQVSRRQMSFSTATINLELRALRRILGQAHEWKVIHRIPRVRQLPGETGRTFVLTFEQEEAYLGATAGDYHDFTLLMLDTGLRVGEALSLEWPQVHLGPDSGRVTVTAANAKNRKVRHVPLTARLLAILRARGPRKSGYVFHDDGQPLTRRWVQDQHGRIRVLLKLPAEFVPHSLRHTFGTRLGASGADAFTIQKLMGHSSIVISANYVHPTPDAMEQAIARMGDRQAQQPASEGQGGHKPGHIDPVKSRKQTTYKAN